MPGDWTEATIVPGYKGKENGYGCYGGISFFPILAKGYGKGLIERMQKIINDILVRSRVDSVVVQTTYLI